ALTRALRIAEGFPQPDPRLAITLDFLATAEFDRDPRRAEALMERAVDSLARNFPPGDLRLAVFSVYLAQIRLRLGRYRSALDLVDAALPALIAHAAATRIDQALRIRVAALKDLGREAEAARAAIDSRAWANYVTGHGP
ncbi:MAG: hypothetical protein D6754_03345, partial [Alphaproteobacteria bacterium]